MLYTEHTRFLERGTGSLLELNVSKTVLNQKNFRLNDQLQVLRLLPLDYTPDPFEISFD